MQLPETLLFQSDEQFESFHAYEAERRAAKKRNGGGRPPGLRLSTACSVRMVKAVFAPEWFATPIDEGDAERGHEMESRFRAVALDGIEHEYQPRVDWGIGISAFDFHVPAWEYPAEELKSTIGAATMHSDWRITTERRMVAAGMQPGTEVPVIAVHPGNYSISGPFIAQLDDDTHALHARTLWGVNSAYAYLSELGDDVEKSDEWDSPEWWKKSCGLECTCGWCEPLNGWDASAAIERLVVRYGIHIAAFQEACKDVRRVLGVKVKSREYEDDKLHRRILDAAQELAKAKGSPSGKVKISCWAADFDLVRNAADRWQIKPRKPAAVAEGADAA